MNLATAPTIAKLARDWGENFETALKAYHEFFWGLHDKALEQERLAS